MEIPRNVPLDARQLLAPSSTALVIWDMQKGIAGRAHEVDAQRHWLERLLESARKAAVAVVWSRHVAPSLAYTQPAGLRTLMKRQGVERPSELTAYMQEGTIDTEFVDWIAPAADELVLAKSTPSLFIGTPAELRLRARDVATVVLAGVATEQGIEFTARHALALGFHVVIAEDACASFSPDAHELGLAYLRGAVDVMPVESIVAAW